MDNEILDAELVFEESDIILARRSLNISLAGTIAFAIVFLMMAVGFGKMAAEYNQNLSENREWWEIPLDERHSADLNLTGLRSSLPVKGEYEAQPYQEVLVEVQLPPSEEDQAPGPALMHIAYWLPNVPEGTQVPVLATIHPYYDFGGEGMPGVGDDSSPNTVPDAGVGKWLYDEFLPHGYALAQVSTFGTGKSTHCQDVKGLGEQVGIQAAVEWLGTQNWSNGKVGLMGKSYAGTTNWEAAQNPSEHLKTIVPISGSIGVQQMFYRNGSSEFRALGYDLAYQGATSDPTLDDLRMCSDDVVGPLNPWSTWGWAEFGGAEWNDYWEERYHLQDVIDNYKGSVYLVWGMQDWNVDPYHAFPTYQMLRDAGINTRGIMGQWAHNYPDQPDRHGDLESGFGAEAYPEMTRMDWAIEIFAWFQFYLKGLGEEPESHVQMQRNDGLWHVEETWPPEDVEWRKEQVSASGPVSQLQTQMFSIDNQEDMMISGLPTLHLEVTAMCNGGQIFATMFDASSNLRLGHGMMDLRYRDGGYDAKPVIPGLGYTMLMEFNPMDVIVPAGNGIRIELSETGMDYLPSPTCQNIGIQVNGGEIGLPLLEREVDAPQWFDVPNWWDVQE